ncbi:alpha-amylase family glycosyl hydrolase [Nocardioides ferulae]|uniref:alpha-amylase family glycosyl hydrolase n=1 Tax=Nocardioides ferulae TaxID=2340821 RepID=UPI000EB34E28|nr:alpha-amylase family glycosyl hydrolase [Nocardioides ferulae]
MRRTIRAALVTAGLTAALGASALPAQAVGPDDDERAIARHSLRGPLTDQSFYFVMADRFANGDTGNDTGGLTGGPNETGFDPTARGFYQGGDLAGLTGQLDYIEGLGTDAIWLTPVFKNKAVQLEDGPSAGYHGYWITDFTQIDPHLGSNDELTALVDAAHERGMKVFFDIITNHTADVIGYEQGSRTAYVPKDVEPYRDADGEPFDDRDFAGGPLSDQAFPELDPATSFPYVPVLDDGEEDLKVPAWLNDLSLYHNRGNTTFTGEDSQYGDFFGLDDLFTEHPTVRDGMIDIYRTWVEDFGIDGFRIDTMKHVDDAFWESFGPALLETAHEQGNDDFLMFGEVALDGSGAAAKAFTSHYTTSAQMQAILDFPFQWAAEDFAAKSQGNSRLGRFFRNDDWYTDADSNVYSLPTFLGNHDMGRFGFFVGAENPDADADELLARDRLGHELMFLSRGQPVVYYGDEQGFTGGGPGNDQYARQTMFASQVPDYADDVQLGTDGKTPATDSFDPEHPLYRTIADLDALTERHPALRDGAHQMRFASAGGPGLVAFSRIDAREQREYVVALNNGESQATARVRTYVPRATFRKIYGEGPKRLRTNGSRALKVSLPALSTGVYALVGRVPESRRAPQVKIGRVSPAAVARSRMQVPARVGGTSFNEVTFSARVAGGRWHSIGTDDTRPYRVFHDVSDLAPGVRLRYRAAVLDNAGHSRTSRPVGSRVPSPSITVNAPGAGTVSAIDPLTVAATVDPERPTQSVRFERAVGDGDWQTIGTDTSSPAYQVTDDVSDLPLGTELRYRAILLEPGAPEVTSAEVVVTTAPPTPARDTVTLVGDLQSEVGCPEDWSPACEQSRLAFDETDGKWHGTFDLPAGTWSWKVAIDGSWDENYGAGGAAGGDNLSLEVPEGGGSYVFTWDQSSHVPSVEPATP